MVGQSGVRNSQLSFPSSLSSILGDFIGAFSGESCRHASGDATKSCNGAARTEDHESSTGRGRRRARDDAATSLESTAGHEGSKGPVLGQGKEQTSDVPVPQFPGCFVE